MWRYLFMALAVAGAATQYPLLFQEKADEIVARREAERRPEPTGARAAEAASPAGRTARIEADGRGHFLVKAKMNGRGVDVLVDTGATLVAINETTARRLGIRLEREDFRHKVSTANGETSAAAVKIDEIRIGRVTVEDVDATVLKDSALSSTLLGMSFLSRLRRFEVDSGTLVLTQ